jgi:hypothetical protein
MPTEIINKNAGRPKGSSNKTTLEIRTAWTEFVLKNFADAQNIYDGLTEIQKMSVLKGISEMVLPKRATLEIDDAPEENPYDLSRLTFEETLKWAELMEKAQGIVREPILEIEYKSATNGNKKPF